MSSTSGYMEEKMFRNLVPDFQIPRFLPGVLRAIFFLKNALGFLVTLLDYRACSGLFFLERWPVGFLGLPRLLGMLKAFFSWENCPLDFGMTHKWIWIWIYPVCDPMGYPVNRREG